jgi:threonine dehydrogenase-like Zn-dependent dehydrogenase
MNTSHAPQGSVQEKTDTFLYKAAVLDRPGSIKYVQMPKPVLGKEELLVKLEGVGLCASNIPVWEGREWFEYPMAPGLPGHEAWGVIEQKGASVKSFRIGQRVTFLQGNAFAEYAEVSAKDAVEIPSELDGLPFPGEPLGCLMNIFNRAEIQKGQSVAIIGLGFIGIGLLKLCKEKGAKVLALSRRDFSLQKAAGEADICIKMEEKSKIIKTVQEYTGGQGCNRVIECTGKQGPLNLATEIIGNYGRLVIAGYHQDGPRTVNMQQWNWKAIDVVNAHERDPEKYIHGIRSAIKAVKQGLLKPEELLTHQFTFEQLPEALNLLRDCPDGYIKGYIKF